MQKKKEKIEKRIESVACGWGVWVYCLHFNSNEQSFFSVMPTFIRLRVSRSSVTGLLNRLERCETNHRLRRLHCRRILVTSALWSHVHVVAVNVDHCHSQSFINQATEANFLSVRNVISDVIE